MLDLEEFMAKARVDDGVVAAAVRCDRTTISRLRRRVVKRPAAVTLLALDRWAELLRRKKGWPRRDRLSWDHLLDRRASRRS